VVGKVIVGAHYGLRDWLAQRITAVVMAGCTLVFLGVLLAGGPLTYASWKALFTKGPMPFIALLFAVSALIHAWIGMRDILMDYIKPTAIRLSLEIGVLLLIAVYVGWTVQVLWR